MNEWMQALQDAAALHGEMKRLYLSIGALGLVACACWAIQEWGVRNSAIALGWFGMSCLGAVSSLSIVLVAIGML